MLKGIIINTHVTEGSLVPSIKQHQLSVVEGFSNSDIAAGAWEALGRAKEVLTDSAELKSLNFLEQMLRNNSLPVFTLINTYKNNHSVIKTMSSFDNLQTDE